MKWILDAGALLALERGSTEVRAVLRDAAARGVVARTHGGVVGQVWRGGARQARLSIGLRGVEVVPLDEALGRDAGTLLAVAGTSDVIDAAVVLLAEDGDAIITSDPGDIAHLARAAGVWVEVLAV